ncbi:hypothetical protein FRC18_002066 [Serendipita sp. 400]|nr:hypothetical protein FRC18_002066 [Serendipita sp. 400]
MSPHAQKSVLSKEYAIPIPQRAPQGPAAVARGIFFLLVLFTALVQINALQFLLLPLSVLPSTRGLYSRGIRYTKAAFGILIVFMCQLFAPTVFRITYEDSGGYGTDWIDVDASTGNLTLKLPKKVVMIANHQIYADWWYLWCFSYFANTHAYILITLKKSLKWIPILGWGMQFFDFIFLARSWVSDRSRLTSALAKIAAHHTTTTSDKPEEDEPLNFLIFPEGTLVSKDTVPVSRKYAEKMNLIHPNHTLLPRSTGLHNSLLALSQLPSLYLMDVTVAYPGIPAGGYGQSYYTLRSIFMNGIPPPEIVYHIRLYRVQKEVPLRANQSHQATGMSLEERKEAALATSKEPDSLQISEDDKTVFDDWLRERWMEKDEWLNEWLQRGGSGALRKGEKIKEVVVPVQLKSLWETIGPFFACAPIVIAIYACSNILRKYSGW